MNNNIRPWLFCFVMALMMTACKQDSNNSSNTTPVAEQNVNKNEEQTVDLPRWAADANIYEVNLRQYTEEGTFEAFSKHLFRLKSMGVEIIWLMPIFPISKEKRKGELGSYYSVSDFKGINPEHGNAEDFKKLVAEIHRLKMKVILDFVPNHTGWDHAWIKDHPEWYTQDSLGNILDPINPDTKKSWGWTDVADLNYDNKDMRIAMIDAMKYWISEFDVDGFRQDVAHQIPVDFWKQACKELKEMKDVFLLAESEVPEIVNNGSFHCDYGWEFHHIINQINTLEKSSPDIRTWYNNYKHRYDKGFQILFTSNHDENTWSGTAIERLGSGFRPFTILTYTLTGMPLVYGGQEEPLDKRLKFFKKDLIKFDKLTYESFYKKLNRLKKQNPALWNGAFGGKPEILIAKDGLFVFERKKGDNHVLVILNLSRSLKDFTFDKDYIGYKSFRSERASNIEKGFKIKLPQWDFRVLYKN